MGRGQDTEAQQVLDLLKVQELSDYLKIVRGNSQTAKGVDIQRSEQNIIALGNELAELQKLDRLTPTQEQRLAYLTNQESDRNQQFNAFLQSPEVQKQIKQLSLEKAKNVDLEEYNRLRESLSQVKNAALFYPLILDDRLELILITATTPPIRKTVNLRPYRSLIFLMQMRFINFHFLVLLLRVNINKGHYSFNLFVMHIRR